MTNDTSNKEAAGNGNEAADMNKQMVELVKAVYHNGMTALKMYFDEVAGQVLNQETYGPVFIFQVKDKSGGVYACGFMMQEMVARFRTGGGDPAEWMASFFFELMKDEGGKPLPKPPSNEEEAKALIDHTLVPHCIEAVKSEFAPEQVHAGLGFVPEHGPVFEAGFPAIRDGNNVCAIPLNLLFTHYMLNRDPAEMLVQGLYKIREEHGME